MAGVSTEEKLPPKSVYGELLERRRFILVVLILIVELGVFAAGIFTPLSPASQQSLSSQTSSEFGFAKTATPIQLVILIFAHNVLIALGDMVPIAGALLFAFSIYGTGLAAQVIVVTSWGFPAQFGLLLLVFPYSLVELSSYAIAAGAGVMLLVALAEKHLRRELRVFVLEGILVTALLLLAAAMETATGLWPTIGLALWLPTGIALTMVVFLARRSWK